jgi:RNA polymerase sigma-70 factor, ECF subfamily
MKQESLTYHQSKSAIELEHDIVEKAKKNARDFAPLYKKYHTPILQFVYLRLDDKDVAIDVTQQVFLKAIENLQKYEFRGLPFSSWLYRIAINELNQLFRKNKKMRTINLNESITSDLIHEMEDEEFALHKETLAIILKKISATDFQLIEMRFFEKRPFSEIGELLDITENNAKVKAYRVIQKLKELFKAEAV